MAWLLTLACLAGIPGILVFMATSRYYLVREDENIFELKMKLQQSANQAMSSKNSEQFWCRHFYDQFKIFRQEHTSYEEMKAWVYQQRKTYQNEFELISWNAAGEQTDITFETEFSKDDWQKILRTLASIYYLARQKPPGIEAKEYQETAKKILGPQFFYSLFSGHTTLNDMHFAWLDSSGNKPPIAFYMTGQGAFLLQFDVKNLSRRLPMKNSIGQFVADSDIVLGATDAHSSSGLWLSSDIPEQGRKHVVNQLSKFGQSYNSFSESEGYYMAYQYIDTNLSIFAIRPIIFKQGSIVLRSALAVLIYLLLTLPVIIHTIRTILLKEPGRISIKFRLAFLFIFATGIPLLALSIISQEHYSHKRHAQMMKAHDQTTSMLLNFDARYTAFLRNQALRIDTFFGNLKPMFLQRAFNQKAYEIINKELRKIRPVAYYLLASETTIIGTRAGCYPYGGTIDNATLILEESPEKSSPGETAINDMLMANMVAKKVMSDLNRTELPNQIISRLEIIAESLFQKTFTEITHSVLSKRGYISRWGLGQTEDMAYFGFLSLKNPVITDYILMAFWQPEGLQKIYLEENIPHVNRNPHGLRLVTRSIIAAEFMPEQGGKNAQIEAFSQRIGQKPTEEIELIKVEGKEYIAVGLNGRQLDNYQLVGLYPLDVIELTIDSQKSELLLLGFFSLLLALGLAHILSQSFVKPLISLREGALAIQNRDFDHRIKDYNADEFGHIAQIFNHTMIGLEELRVARIVQDSLFPRDSYEHNEFIVFGKSVSMSELGGDYLDFFKISEDEFAVLIADVAGHGVGASLVMAMAKAAVISCSESLNAPAQLMNRLHNMLMSFKKRGQRKMMTFQYLFMNAATAKGIYSNAGGWSPLILRNDRKTIDELKLEGPLIGSFKKASFSERVFSINKGDGVVFYTDGFIESADAQGKMLGFDGFKQLLLNAFDTDPKTFYDNIYQLYQQFTNSADAQDDTTIIIMYRRTSN